MLFEERSDDRNITQYVFDTLYQIIVGCLPTLAGGWDYRPNEREIPSHPLPDFFHFSPRETPKI